jgi:hypothetical protein
MKTTLGGDRLGSGNKQEIHLKNYKRSTHDLSYVWRSSMASGTLVPFMSEVGLPGDSFDIDLDADVKTLPTVGPLFGSYKVQLDVFECPVRLYQGKLHMNMLNIGMDMSEVKLPQFETSAEYDPAVLDDNSQINPSSIYAYLNVRGLGRSINGQAGTVTRQFNAVPYLSYWSVYKQYFANVQEERGYVIHGGNLDSAFRMINTVVTVAGVDSIVETNINSANQVDTDPQSTQQPQVSLTMVIKWNSGGTPAIGSPVASDIIIEVNGVDQPLTDLFNNVSVPTADGEIDAEYTVTATDYIGIIGVADWDASANGDIPNTITDIGVGPPQLTEFPLDNIDDMRMQILEDVRSPNAFVIDKDSIAPYGLGLGFNGDWEKAYKLSSQEGLGIKTYQSDLFNNWISTEWIDGATGVNEVSKVSTAGDEFTIDALNLANKVYNMLNRIAISGGTYDDWLDAVYTHERNRGVEEPVYRGSLIKELAFEEVVSSVASDVPTGGAESNYQPLGELGGRGRLTRKNKGGRVRIKCNEPCVILGVVSLTPRIDYSQGNAWSVNLKTMDDFHKPPLDEIGFQDLITDQMAWFDTKCNFQGDVEYKSAGKQPAWINYMTAVNQCRGDFAIDGNSMFMTLNRKYEQNSDGIADLTTYIDPSKFNEIFAYGELDSQNFWVQISNRITARRKMSAKVIPNL